MDTTVPREAFDEVYATDELGAWVIGEPQPAVVALERDGWIRGSVLDAGTGAGEHTIYLAKRGYDVHGIDFAPGAIARARDNAARHGVDAGFAVADALRLGGPGRFDTVLDSALFHVFGPEDRLEYSRRLHAVTRPDALVHVLALSDAEPGSGPRISDTVIREAFTDGWQLEDLRTTSYRAIPNAEQAADLGAVAGEPLDLTAWLARIRRS